MKRLFVTGIALAMLTTASVAYAKGYKEVEVKNGGTIKGRVVYAKGDAPKQGKLEVTKDKEACGGDSCADDTMVVNAENKGIKWAVVYIKKIKEGKAWPEGAKAQAYDQKSCVFTEHVKVIPVGCELEFTNSDSVLHNVKAASMKTSFNKSIPANGSIKETFNNEEEVKIECSVHPWMSAYLYVSEHPYAVVTDENGNFELTDVPPGNYQIIAWHEQLKKHDKKGEKVEVKGGDSHELTLEFK